MGLTILSWYMGVGLVVLASISIYGTWFRSGDTPGNIYGFNENKASWQMRVANVFLVPLAIVFIFVPLWPVILSFELHLPWHKLKFWTTKAERSVPWEFPEKESEFKVSSSDLLTKLSRHEIEELERVNDPLNAAPNLPFGHLNGTWLAFANGLEESCELWSFQGRWKTPHRDWQMYGYVARSGESIGPYFLTASGNVRKV